MNHQEKPQAEQQSGKRIANLSKDGKWRSFPKVPNLLQYVSSGVYFARNKIDGKVIRLSLETSVWTTAKLRLLDFQKKHHENRGTVGAPRFTETVEAYKRDLETESSMKPQSRQYRLRCLQKIQRTWPELWNLRLDQIAEEDCKDWAAKLDKEIACHYYNNTIGTLKQIIAAGIKLHKDSSGVRLENPAAELKRTRITQKDLQLPEPAQFRELVKNVRLRSGGWGPRVGDLIEFLAYSGLRIASEAVWVNWEDIDWQRKEIIVRGNPETGTKNSEVRRVPLIADMENLLSGLPGKSSSTGRILQVVRCNKALARGCQEIGVPRITHHDLRHLFATRCIQSGVDIPTVSRWLEHKDGGALAMRTYGHLRNEHSQQMAQKVKF